MAVYELDVADDVEGFVAAAADFGVRTEIVDQDGPNGMPIVWVYGDPDMVLEFVQSEYDPEIDLDELEDVYFVLEDWEVPAVSA